MELDEMKTAWQELDRRLDRQETLSETFIRESIAARSQRSVNRFLAYELIGAVVMLFVIPFVLWTIAGAGMPSETKLFLKVLFPLLPVTLVWQLVKTYTLFKVDISGNMKSVARMVQRYELYALYEKRVSYFLILLIFTGAIVVYAALRMPLWSWIAMTGLVTAAVLYCVWYYKKFFAANMAAIKRGLEELRDL